MKEKLVENEQLAHLSKKLATIHTEAPIEITVDDLKYDGPNEEDLLTLWQELGFKTLINKADFKQEAKEQKEVTFEIVTKLQPTMLKDAMALHLELENERYHDCRALGLSLTDGETTIFLPMNEVFENDVLKDWLADESKKKYVSDRKATQVMFKRLGYELEGVEFDLLLAT